MYAHLHCLKQSSLPFQLHSQRALRRGLSKSITTSIQSHAQAATASQSHPASSKREVVTLGQSKAGCHIGTIDVASPVASLSIVAKAGPRYQQHGEEGLSAVLRDIFFKVFLLFDREECCVDDSHSLRKRDPPSASCVKLNCEVIIFPPLAIERI